MFSLHSSIAYKSIVQLQQKSHLRDIEETMSFHTNDQTGSSSSRNGLRFGGDIFLLPNVAALFSHSLFVMPFPHSLSRIYSIFIN